MRVVRIPFFRIFYSVTYTVLFLLVLVLLSITPIDHAIQAIENGNFGNAFAVAAVYFVTAVIAIFIYMSRLYTRRTILASIPKSYIPNQDGEVTKSVRRMIVKNLQRSALVAWDSRPRALYSEISQTDLSDPQAGISHRSHRESKIYHHKSDPLINFKYDDPPWGRIVHDGWSSPASTDLPAVEFESILSELPNLLEAKAVSLAPADPGFSFMRHYSEEVPEAPDQIVVAILQRKPNAALRDYLNQLNSIGVIADSILLAKFLSLYEAARFSSAPISEDMFRNLMATFAELLASLVGPDSSAVEYCRSMPVEDVASMETDFEYARARDKASSSADSTHSLESVIHRLHEM